MPRSFFVYSYQNKLLVRCCSSIVYCFALMYIFGIIKIKMKDLYLVSRDKTRNNVSGQAMIEYIIVLVCLLGLVLVLSILIYAFRQNGVRILDLVASEYP